MRGGGGVRGRRGMRGGGGGNDNARRGFEIGILAFREAGRDDGRYSVASAERERGRS